MKVIEEAHQDKKQLILAELKKLRFDKTWSR